MGFDQKLKDLLKLQTTQPDAFTAELDEPWPGMRSDIELALGILVEYQRRGKPLRLIEDFQINEETGEVKVLMPEWQTSLKRSLVETAFYRYKVLIGRSLRARTLSAQKVEARIACTVINRMTSLGMPISRKVA